MKFVNILALISVSMISFATSRRGVGTVESGKRCGDIDGDGKAEPEEICKLESDECCVVMNGAGYAGDIKLTGLCGENNDCVELKDYHGKARRKY